jgi:hypothetical protein
LYADSANEHGFGMTCIPSDGVAIFNRYQFAIFAAGSVYFSAPVSIEFAAKNAIFAGVPTRGAAGWSFAILEVCARLTRVDGAFLSRPSALSHGSRRCWCASPIVFSHWLRHGGCRQNRSGTGVCQSRASTS